MIIIIEDFDRLRLYFIVPYTLKPLSVFHISHNHIHNRTLKKLFYPFLCIKKGDNSPFAVLFRFIPVKIEYVRFILFIPCRYCLNSAVFEFYKLYDKTRRPTEFLRSQSFARFAVVTLVYARLFLAYGVENFLADIVCDVSCSVLVYSL